MTTQEDLQHLFDAALRALDEPVSKPAAADTEHMFAPPPWKCHRETATSKQPLPAQDMQPWTGSAASQFG